MLRQELRRQTDPQRAAVLQRFFKTGPGGYAAGDKFLGLTVPQLRALAKRYRGLPLRDIGTLLRSPIHEERLLALLLLVQAYRDGDDDEQHEIYKLDLPRAGGRLFFWREDLMMTAQESLCAARRIRTGRGQP